MSGDWKQCEMWNGTYTLDDLLQWHEVAEVKSINDRRRQEYEKLMRGAEA